MPDIATVLRSLRENASPSTVAVTVVTGAGVVALYKLSSFLLHYNFSPLHKLPGPPRGNLFLGQLRALLDSENSVIQEKWVEEYGPTISYTSILGVNNFLFFLSSSSLMWFATDIHLMDHGY